jgi:hypothetical protein
MAKTPSKRKTTKKELRRRALAGWNTRRRNLIAREQKLIETAAKVLDKKPRKRKKPNPGITPEKLKEMLLEERAARERAEARIAEIYRREALMVDVAELTRDWVPTRIGHPEMLKSDMTLALHPSRLRHVEETLLLQEKLKEAKEKGEYEFIDMCDSMAAFYDIPIQEVYTLYWSP